MSILGWRLPCDDGEMADWRLLKKACMLSAGSGLAFSCLTPRSSKDVVVVVVVWWVLVSKRNDECRWSDPIGTHWYPTQAWPFGKS